MDKKLFLVAAVSAAVGAAAAVGVMALIAKKSAGKYNLCMDNNCEEPCECDCECDCTCEDDE